MNTNLSIQNRDTIQIQQETKNPLEGDPKLFIEKVEESIEIDLDQDKIMEIFDKLFQKEQGNEVVTRFARNLDKFSKIGLDEDKIFKVAKKFRFIRIMRTFEREDDKV